MRGAGWTAIASLLSAVACGGNTDSDGSGGAGTGGASAGGPGSGGAASGGAASGGAASGGASSGGAGSGGAGPSVCDQILSDYKDQLETAKQCNPLINAIQCTEQVQSAPMCGCPTFVNPANQEALTNLHQIQTNFYAQKCDEQVACTTMECPSVQGGGCSVDPGGTTDGHCIDYLPD